MDLLKEALADAKLIKETATANAKRILAEEFQPAINRLVSNKLAEEEEMDDEEMFETDYMDDGDDATPSDPLEEMDDMDDELDVESIMSELEDEELDDPAPVAPAPVAPAPVAPAPVAPAPAPVAPAAPAADPLAADYGDDTALSDEEIDEILREFEEEEDLDDTFVESFDEEDEFMESTTLFRENKRLKSDVRRLKKQLDEALSAVRVQKSTINEVNLLNAKLMFSVNLNKAFSLTESQQVSVLKAFDLAKSLREAKLTYATLVEQFKNSGKAVKNRQPKNNLTENKKQLNESIIPVNRFKKLAGLIK